MEKAVREAWREIGAEVLQQIEALVWPLFRERARGQGLVMHSSEFILVRREANVGSEVQRHRFKFSRLKHL